LDFFEERATIDDVIAEYDKLGFDTNQDIPGMTHSMTHSMTHYRLELEGWEMWEELYRAMPKGTKVILTVRDSDEVWFDSYYKFTGMTHIMTHMMTNFIT